MKTKIISFLIITMVLSACELEPEVSEAFILKTNSKISNSDELNKIEVDIEQYNKFLKEIYKHGNLSLVKSNDKEFANNIEFQKVLIRLEVDKLFDPDNKFCELPKKVSNSLQRLKRQGKSWAPQNVVNFVKELPDSAIFVNRTSITALLHLLIIKSKDGQIRNFTLFNAPTFKNLDIERFVIKEGFNSFFYSLDCAGFLNAAIEGSGAVPGADIKSSAKSTLENKKSMFIAGGVIMSPIAAAYHGNSLGTNLDTLERIKILKEITSIPDINETDSIISTTSYEAIWMSNTCSSSFNGEISFGGRTNLGVGVASLSATAESGGKISRTSYFSSYKTYFTNRKVISELKPFTVKEVISRIKTLEKIK